MFHRPGALSSIIPVYQHVSTLPVCPIPHAPFLECSGSSLVLLTRPWQEGLHCPCWFPGFCTLGVQWSPNSSTALVRYYFPKDQSWEEKWVDEERERQGSCRRISGWSLWIFSLFSWDKWALWKKNPDFSSALYLHGIKLKWVQQ